MYWYKSIVNYIIYLGTCARRVPRDSDITCRFLLGRRSPEGAGGGLREKNLFFGSGGWVGGVAVRAHPNFKGGENSGKTWKFAFLGPDSSS